MWIITKDGFVSLVEHDTDHSKLRARARRLEHLADTFDLNDADIIDLGDNAPDYRWHADIPKLNAAQAMYDAVMDIDYASHVKENVAGDDHVFYSAMLGCWRELHKLQDPPRPVPQRHLWEPITFADPDACPGCGAVSTFVRGAWEVVHEDDCSWFHGPDPLEEPAVTLDGLSEIATKVGELADKMLAVKAPPTVEPEAPLPVFRWADTVDVCAVCEDEFATGDEYVVLPEDDDYGDPEAPAHVACAEDNGWDVHR